MQTICFILNSHSGGESSPEVESSIRKVCAGRAEIAICQARTPEQLAESLREATANNYEMIVAGGGDGTVNAVASAVAGSGRTLGVLPLGTLNHFAKDMGIPLALEAAVETLLTGRVVAVDVAEVNGRVFVNNSSLGLYPKMVLLREAEQERGWGKWSAMAKAAVTVLRRHPFMTVSLQADQKEMTRNTPFIFVGNNEYAISGVEAGSRARLTDGKLSLYVTRRQSRMGLVALALKSLTGLVDRNRDLDYMTPAELTIRMHRSHANVAMDGEVVRMETPLRYRIRPQALKVMVPLQVEE